MPISYDVQGRPLYEPTREERALLDKHRARLDRQEALQLNARDAPVVAEAMAVWDDFISEQRFKALEGAASAFLPHPVCGGKCISCRARDWLREGRKQGQPAPPDWERWIERQCSVAATQGEAG